MHKNIFKKNIRIKDRNIMLIGYVYTLIPVYVFFVGYFKSYISVILTIILTYTLIQVQKNNSNKEYFNIKLGSIIIILIISGTWVYTSGVGGYWLQRADWQWRNALVNDLTNYSWPVIFPDTNTTLIYYFNFFLPSAVVGKIFGIDASYLTLLLFTWLGVVISILLVTSLLKCTEIKKILVLALFFISYGGLEQLRGPIVQVFGLNRGAAYQFSSNTTLLDWVTNQTIVVWIMIPILLKNRNIKNYAFNGFCTLTSAPLPFCGYFLICIIDAVYQLYTKYKKEIKVWLFDCLSKVNLISSLVLIGAYYLFYSLNTSVNGYKDFSGFGIYTPLSLLAKSYGSGQYITFMLFNFGLYAFLIYSQFKKNILYWCIVLSLLILPFFRVGFGWDFQMRATIPALFLLMIMCLDYILDSNTRFLLSKVLLISFFGFNLCSLYAFRADIYAKTQLNNDIKIRTDELNTFANKNINGMYCGGWLMNFISEKYSDSIFFKYLARKKSHSAINRDKKITSNFLNKHNFEFISGRYKISPLSNKTSHLFISNGQFSLSECEPNFILSDSIKDSYYQFFFGNFLYPNIYVVNESNLSLSGFVKGGGSQAIFGSVFVPNSECFNIVPAGDGSYFFVWFNKYALTFNGKNISVKSFDKSIEQKWNLEFVD